MKLLPFALALALSGATVAAVAGTDDPLHSAACAQARARLDALLAEPQARRSPRLDEARRRVSDDCLGKTAGTAQRSGAPDLPIAVAPAALLGTPAAMAQPRVATPPLPPLAVPRPATITTCDAGGCWDNEGRRLNQTGPFLIGPGGLCNSQGAAVSCP